MTKHIALSMAIAAALAGCSIKQFESAPVTVQTPKGPVVCQLYTRNMVEWDRAISRPDSMGVQEADAICVAEGKRIQSGG